MDLNAQKEQFSRAYVQAVAAVSGYTWSQPSVDDDSIDLTLAAKGGGGTIRSPKLDLQLKCHAGQVPTDNQFSFPVKLKNYDDLRNTTVLVPRILVIVLVPDLVSDWLSFSESELALRRSGYWVSLRGLQSSTNTTNVTVNVSRTRPFSPTELSAIMARIGSGSLP